MSKVKVPFLICLMLLIPFSFLGARGFLDSTEFSIHDLRFTHAGKVPLPTYIALGMDYYGVNINREVDTRLFLDLDGGRRYQSHYYTEDGAPLGPRSQLTEVTVGGRIGMEQGILWNNRNNENLVSVYAAIAPRWSKYNTRTGKANYILGQSAYTFTEELSVFSLGILTGARYNDVYKNMHAVRDGVAAELYAEIQPGFWGNGAYYPGIMWNIGASASYHLPVFDLTEEWEETTFAGEFTTRLIVDYLHGYGYTQLERRTAFGGLYYNGGRLGDTIRGYEVNSYDANMSIALNTELNLIGPQIVFPNIYPKATVFLDMGYAGYTQTAYTTESFDQHHYLLSTGFDIGLSILDIIEPRLRVAFPLVAPRMDQKKIVAEFVLFVRL